MSYKTLRGLAALAGLEKKASPEQDYQNLLRTMSPEAARAELAKAHGPAVANQIASNISNAPGGPHDFAPRPAATQNGYTPPAHAENMANRSSMEHALPPAAEPQGFIPGTRQARPEASVSGTPIDHAAIQKNFTPQAPAPEVQARSLASTAPKPELTPIGNPQYGANQSGLYNQQGARPSGIQARNPLTPDEAAAGGRYSPSGAMVAQSERTGLPDANQARSVARDNFQAKGDLRGRLYQNQQSKPTNRIGFFGEENPQQVAPNAIDEMRSARKPLADASQMQANAREAAPGALGRLGNAAGTIGAFEPAFENAAILGRNLGQSGVQQGTVNAGKEMRERYFNPNDPLKGLQDLATLGVATPFAPVAGPLAAGTGVVRQFAQSAQAPMRPVTLPGTTLPGGTIDIPGAVSTLAQQNKPYTLPKPGDVNSLFGSKPSGPLKQESGFDGAQPQAAGATKGPAESSAKPTSVPNSPPTQQKEAPKSLGILNRPEQAPAPINFSQKSQQEAPAPLKLPPITASNLEMPKSPIAPVGGQPQTEQKQAPPVAGGAQPAPKAPQMDWKQQFEQSPEHKALMNSPAQKNMQSWNTSPERSDFVAGKPGGQSFDQFQAAKKKMPGMAGSAGDKPVAKRKEKDTSDKKEKNEDKKTTEKSEKSEKKAPQKKRMPPQVSVSGTDKTASFRIVPNVEALVQSTDESFLKDMLGLK